MDEFVLKLEAALKLEMPYSERPSAPSGTPAAVLMLFGSDGKLELPSLLLVKRTDLVETHKGQMAFPGGVIDKEDESPVAAALRETHEEVGLKPSDINVIGQMPGIWTVTGFWITPVVGYLTRPLQGLEIITNPVEVAETVWIPLSVLMEDGIYRSENLAIRGKNYVIHSYRVKNYFIWGATGAIIKNMLDRLHALR
ncbi:MAG: CoA pyrophosphatase [Bdellovibrionota bacterium]